MALNGTPISKLQSVTCHMGSHSLTCHPTQVNTPRLNPSEIGRYSIYLRPRLETDIAWQPKTNLTVDDVMELLEFILTTTYFVFRGQIYSQKFGTAMGSPVSPMVADIFVEFLEQSAIASVPAECKPILWKQYVDDILEIIKKQGTDGLTQQLNSVDDTGSIKFTAEPEKDLQMPFLDTLIMRKPKKLKN